MGVVKKDILEDRDLIERVLRGDKAIYAEIVRKYNPYLYKIGRTYGFNHLDTEDLMQDTFVNAYLGLKKFEFRSSFKTWISKIMLHACYHKRQSIKTRKDLLASGFSNQEKMQPMFIDHRNDTEPTVNNKELNGILEDAILQIPETYRMVFTLREIGGYNTKETAEALDLTESNVKVRLSRAKSMIKRALLKDYKKEEIFEFNLIHCDPMVDRVMEIIHELDD